MEIAVPILWDFVIFSEYEYMCFFIFLIFVKVTNLLFKQNKHPYEIGKPLWNILPDCFFIFYH